MKNKTSKLHEIDRQSLNALAHSIKAGVPPRETLICIARSKRGKARAGIDAIADMFQFGISYSDAFSRTSLARSPLFMHVIRISESNGQIAMAFEMIVAHMSNSSKAKSHVIGLSVYPIIVLCMTIAFMLFALLVIVPNIKDVIVMPGVAINPITEALLFLSHALRDDAIAAIGLAVCMGAVIYAAFRVKSVRHRLEAALFRLPVISGLFTSYVFGGFASFVALYVKFRSDIGTAFELMAETASVHGIKNEFRMISDSVKKGSALSSSLKECALIPSMWVLFATVAERSSSYEEMFGHLASHHAETLDHSARICMKALEPVLMVCVGVLVGLLAYGILSPLYGLMNQIR